MDKQALIRHWLAEENIAHIKGWDFSHIDGLYEEKDDLPWDYKAVIKQHLMPHHRLLDIDTGGGEFLLSLQHPYALTAATEAYLPNIHLCQEALLPLGIDFRPTDHTGLLPYGDESFDMVINRHGDFFPAEIFRVLKPGGLFITQQVGAENDRELVNMLLPQPPALPFPEQYLRLVKEKFTACGFTILDGQEAFRSIRFRDVGALVWFARIIQWEFPGFSVQSSLEQLLRLQSIIDQGGVIEGRTHRFLLVAKKPAR